MLSDVMNGFCRFTQGINRLVSWLVIVLLAVLVCIVVVAVFYRYVLGDSLVWSSEAARYLCIWVGFLATSVAMRKKMHIGLTFFTNRFGEKGKRLLGIVSQLAIFIFLIFIVYLGFQLAIKQMNQTSPALMLPMGIPYLAIPVSAVLMSLQSLSLLIVDVFNINEEEDEAC